MGQLTADMSRLAADVRKARSDRQQLLESLRRAGVARRRDASQRQAHFRIEHLLMARSQHQHLSEFSLRIRRLVSLLRGQVDNDLRAARRAWHGPLRPAAEPGPVASPVASCVPGPVAAAAPRANPLPNGTNGHPRRHENVPHSKKNVGAPMKRPRSDA